MHLADQNGLWSVWLQRASKCWCYHLPVVQREFWCVAATLKSFSSWCTSSCSSGSWVSASDLCHVVGETKTPPLFWQVYQQPTGLPTGFYSQILNYRDDMLLPLIYNKDYISFYSRILNYRDDMLLPLIYNKDCISRAVSGTKVNIVNVFNYEFPTQLITCKLIWK